ncbi:MAG TPA: D-aminoacylase [Thermoanaerobaculia bacterium]|nr:D-aminoacylase [Thermoanaerobaculia bacterium]
MRMRTIGLLVVLFSAFAMSADQGTRAQYDLIIRNGRIVDGTGNPWYRGDVAITNDQIVAMAPRIPGKATLEIPADGLVISPGFIDLHTHARRGIFENPGADNYVRQGVTTIFEGPDGDSPLPIGAFLQRLEKADTAPNVGTFVGHNSIREKVVGRNDRAATADEMNQMTAMTREGMLHGAFGLSSGLFYAPGVFSSTEEVIELAKVAGAMGGIHISHIRDEAAGVAKSVRETVRIGEEGGLPTQVTHHKVMGKPNVGKSRETLLAMSEARARGVDATSDQYPYTASSTSLGAGLLPSWANEGGREAMLKRLGDGAQRARILEYVREAIRLERGGNDPKNIQIALSEADAAINGKNLTEIMLSRGVEPTVANAAETSLQLIEKGQVRAIFHAISEPDLEAIMVDPTTMVASDGEVAIMGRASPHPRSYGTFARVLGLYVRERKLLTLEDAVRKMTSFPAQRVGLLDRGLLRPGMKADLVIFDAARIRDRATYINPHQYAEGISAVVINGVVVFRNETMTGARPGVVLRGPGYSRAATASALPSAEPE